jgi:hypothetical protein
MRENMIQGAYMGFFELDLYPIKILMYQLVERGALLLYQAILEYEQYFVVNWSG